VACDEELQASLQQIADQSGVTTLAVSLYDYETDKRWSLRGDRWFHAASTIKVAILIALFDAVDQGRFTLDSRLHIRNRFLSVIDAEPYRIDPSRDPNSKVHAQIGKTMKVGELAEHMIVTSSNLATNLIYELIGAAAARATIKRLGLDGIDLRRGVEDHKAFEAGVNNRITAEGLVRMFRLIHEGKAISTEGSKQMLNLLLSQEYNSGIPAGIPPAIREEARVAHKTGEIQNAAHDAGLVYLPGREPYAVAILTEMPTDAATRKEAIARTSRTVYDQLVRGPG
jgi:beta-lactamase class A